MTEILNIRLLGLTELSAKLDRITPAIQDRLRVFIARFTLTLRDQVKANISERFKSEGPLYQSIQGEMTEEIGAVSGRVYSDGVPYAAIQEFGGKTPPHVIVPRNASVLAFMMPARMGLSSGGGMNGMVFAKLVNHPGSNIPERSYARLALVQQRVPFEAGIRAVVDEAVGETMTPMGTPSQ